MLRLRENRITIETWNIDKNATDDNTRQLCSTTHMDKVYKEFFKVYLMKCEKTHKHIKQENE